MLLGILTMITALSISAVAIYYSVAGLMTIFAAAAVPIMIMGGALEIGKLVTAVWLHRYWSQATWWLKTYLTTAVLVLMFITSMGIFGFLSKAHIEQTASANEGIAQLERIESEITRNEQIIARAESKILQLESSGTGADANVQSQIDKEQERIDRAFERIQPAIAQQNKIIEDARTNDNTRTKPYEDQLANIQAEILRLENSAKEYETTITSLEVDNSTVEPLLAQIAAIEEEIIRVTNQLNSGERDQIRAGQAIIGVTNDGLFGGNTRTALASWVSGQRDRVAQVQSEISQIRRNSQTTVNTERERLAGVVKDIRERQIPALKERELTMLGKIDEVRQTESPAIATARDEIQRLRESAESQVAQSQTLIERLRSQLAQTDKADEIDSAIKEQNDAIRTASNEVDRLFEEKFRLEAEYRKLEAEVGPVKYIAEFIYGEQADTNLLEQAVRWVIIVIIFVFDPLAVLLLIASQYTFEFNSKRKDDDGESLRLEREEYERQRAQRIIDNPGYNITTPTEKEEEEVDVAAEEESTSDNTETVDGDGFTPGEDTGDQESVPVEQETDSEQIEKEVSDVLPMEETNTLADATVRDMVPEDDVSVDDDAEQRVEQTQVQSDGLTPDEIARGYSEVDPLDVYNDDRLSTRMDIENPIEVEKKDTESSEELKQAREKEFKQKEQNNTWQDSKRAWKEDHPNETLKTHKDLFISGVIDKLPWEGYIKDDSKKKTYIMKQGDQQIRKTSD